MKKISLFLILLLVFPLIGWSKIIIVNKTEDSNNPGTLRQAIEQEVAENDTVLMDVKGELKLNSSINFSDMDNLVILGPYPKHFTISPSGTFTGTSLFEINDASNLIIEKIGFEGGNIQAINITNSINIKIKHCLFEEITASVNGAGVSSTDSQIEIFGCSFINLSGIQGGALFFSGNFTSTVINCSFIDNSAENGGALFVTDGCRVQLYHNTFSENTAGASGEVAAVQNSGVIELQNNAGAGNGIGNQFVNLIDGSFNSNGGNVFKTGSTETISFSTGTDMAREDIDPGLRVTILEDGYGLKYLPIRSSSSDFIGAGVPMSPAIETDGRRAPRVLYDMPDAGACEYTPLIVTNESDLVATPNSFSWCVSGATQSINFIEFDLTLLGPYIIPNLLTPEVTENTYIDGYTQSGSAIAGPGLEGSTGVTGAVISIQIENSIGAGLRVVASNSSISGLRFANCSTTALIVSASAVSVFGNEIGIDNDGNIAPANLAGVRCSGDALILGGNEHFQRNVISGNGNSGIMAQVVISGDRNRIAGNFIGVSPDGIGIYSVAANASGILTNGSSNNRIGSATTHLGRNIIVGNAVGILLNVSDADIISNNYIGVGFDGVTAIPNTKGISLSNAISNLSIGLETKFGRNVIANNREVNVEVINANKVTMVNNFVGVGSDGLGSGLSDKGILISSFLTDDILIGSSSNDYRNVISGNKIGIEITQIGTNCIIRNNILGLDSSGTSIVNNQEEGIKIESTNQEIKIGEPGLGNIMAGYTVGLGAAVHTVGCSNVTISANVIGTGIGGVVVASGNYGIYDQGSDKFTIGGTTTESKNYISDFTNDGIYLNNSDSVFILNNHIGIRVNGLEGGNDKSGIKIDAGENIRIGGALSAQGNNIHNNSEAGISITNNTKNTEITKNSIFNNGKQGIDINGDGTVLPIDKVLVPTGNNEETDYPEIISAFSCAGAGNTKVGVVTHVPVGTTVEIEVFSNSLMAESHGEGEQFIRSFSALTTGFSDTLQFDLGSNLPVGTLLSATLTQNNNTSEFGVNYAVTDAPAAALFEVFNDTCLGANNGYTVIKAPEAYYFGVQGNVFSYNMEQDTLFLGNGNFTLGAEYLNGCITSKVITIEQGDRLTSEFDLVDDTCEMNTGEIIPTNVLGSEGPFQYSYDGGITKTTANLLNLSKGSYTVIVYDDLLGCSTINYNIEVDDLKDIVDESFSYDDSFCEGTTVLPNSVSTPTGVFSIISGAGNPIINSITGEITGGSIFPEKYEVLHTVGVCQEKDTIFIDYLSLEVPDIEASSYCAENPESAKIIEIPGGIFSLSPGDNRISINSETGAITGGKPGATYNIVYTSPGLCPSTDTAKITIYERNAPPELITKDSMYCEGDEIVKVSNLNADVLNWYIGNKDLIVFQGLSFVPSSLEKGRNLIYGALVDNNGCRSEFDSIPYSLGSNDGFNAGENAEVCIGYTLELNAQGGDFYNWDESPYLSDTLIRNPIIENLQFDQNFYVTISNTEGCAIRDSVYVKISDLGDCEVEIFNVFTPNNDGDNDTWYIQGIEPYSTNIVYIYNRWGDEIKQLKNYNNTDVFWSGENNAGDMVETGTYFFVVDILETKSINGWVQILK